MNENRALNIKAVLIMVIMLLLGGIVTTLTAQETYEIGNFSWYSVADEGEGLVHAKSTWKLEVDEDNKPTCITGHWEGNSYTYRYVVVNYFGLPIVNDDDQEIGFVNTYNCVFEGTVYHFSLWVEDDYVTHWSYIVSGSEKQVTLYR